MNLSLEGGYLLNSITSSFDAPNSGANGTRIAWTSDNTSTISISRGLKGQYANATRPTGGVDVQVKLTATITKGTATDIKQFALTIKHMPTDSDAVAAAKEALKLTLFPGNTMDSVTNSFYLDSIGLNGATITWASDNGSVIQAGKNPMGGWFETITRPNGGSDVIVHLTATIIKGSVNETKRFDLTVKSKQ